MMLVMCLIECLKEMWFQGSVAWAHRIWEQPRVIITFLQNGLIGCDTVTVQLRLKAHDQAQQPDRAKPGTK